MHWSAYNSQFGERFREGRPFLFLTDFECSRLEIYSSEEAAERGIRASFRDLMYLGFQPEMAKGDRPFMEYLADAKHRAHYRKAFREVQEHLRRGDSFLTNLTVRTPVRLKGNPESVYELSNAPYKLHYPGKFVVFSPELFFSIQGRRICSRPMKGTIDARLADAQELLISNPKEQFEHNTIVDLIRNDLSRVAKQVRVENFRYVEQLETNQGPILQSSSEICGLLPEEWQERFASLLSELLPAGSISGAPKERTLEIIRKAEGEKRGFYTGVFGIFDGTRMECAVAIRFLEEEDGEFYYRSGGGITHLSEEEEEYCELLAKIYLPIV